MKKHRIGRACLASLLLAVVSSLVAASFSAAQSLPRTVSIAYSNNINGEIDPCPT